MTDLDDRIKTLLDERARDHVTDPRLPRTVVTRSRRRRALVGAGAGLAAVAAIVVGAAALREVAFEQQTAGTPSVTPSPDPGPVAGYPDTFVGLRDGEIVLVDTTSGQPVRVLVDRANLGGGAGGLDLEVAPDGSTVYFVPSGTPELIMAVPAEGGEPALVAEGSKPTISPDGRSLAHVDCSSPFTGCGNAIMVLDLDSGDTTVWDVGGSDRWVGQLAWLPDGRRLAYSMFYAGDANPTMHVLDTVDDIGVVLSEHEEIGPDRRGAGWTVNGYHAPTDGLVVQHFCCSTSPTDAPDESSVISVTADGRVVTTLLLTADWIDIELDASGQHFLLLDLGGAAYRVDQAGGEPQPIAGAQGFEHIDW